METRRLRAITALAALASAGCALATPAAVRVCVDYGCDETRSAQVTPAEWQSIADLFSATADATAERTAIAEAVGKLETLVGDRVGTAGDAPRNSTLDTGVGQLDCIAESRNTHAYLELLAAGGLIAHHRIVERQVRHRWIFGTHWTAVVEETATGERFAVDSWYGANGDPAIVQPLATWFEGRVPDAGI
jgi:hypothetical protein